MDFGICFKGDIDIKRTIRLAQQAESGGFSYGWTFDSHVLWKEAMVMLTLLASRTARMKWGPLVTNAAVRSLDLAASCFATLNLVSGGRAVCGIGRGDSSRRVLGYPPTTIKRMMESTAVIRDLAEGRKSEINGVPVHLNWANPDFKLPMWIAGYGPKVLRAAGAGADGIILQIAEPSLCKWFIEQARAGARQAGRNPDELRFLAAAPVFISEDMELCRRQVRWFPAMVGNHIADLIKNNSIGVPAELLEAIEGRELYDYLQHGEKDADHLDWVTNAVIDGFSVIGTTKMIVEKLARLKEVGVDQFVIYLMCEEEEQIVETFARDVIPVYSSS